MKCGKKCNDASTTFCKGACANVGTGPSTTHSCTGGCDDGKWATDCSKTCNPAICKSTCVQATGVCDSCKDGKYGVATNCAADCNNNCAVSPGCEDNGNCKAPGAGQPITCSNSSMWGAKCDKKCDDLTDKRCASGCTNVGTDASSYIGSCTGGNC